jgi:hypothetical protein
MQNRTVENELEEAVKGVQQELHNRLMVVSRHRKEFQEAIREFNQSGSVVGKRKVFLFGPAPLSIKDVQETFRGGEEALDCHSAARKKRIQVDNANKKSGRDLLFRMLV